MPIDQQEKGAGLRSVTFVDSTLCAAQHALWRGRMTNAMLLPFLRGMDGMGFGAIDIMDGDLYEIGVRTLKEDPWQRVRLAVQRASRTPLNVWTRGRCMFGVAPLPDPAIALAIRRLAASGVRRHTCYDALNDIGNLEVPVRASKEAGLYVCGALVYARAPTHADRGYADKAHALIALGVDSICLWDPAGILDPDSARTLVSALRSAVGGRPLEIRAHCRSGLAEIVYLESVRLGADVLHTATMPLAGGASLPPVEYFAEHLAREGIAIRPASPGVAAMTDYFGALADAHDLPTGAHTLRDFHGLDHQLSGALLVQLEDDARERGLAARMDEILTEVRRVRSDLGHPPTAVPIGRFLCRQALLNVAHDRRYEVLDPGVARYAVGAYGKPPGPIEARVLARARTWAKEEELDRAGSSLVDLNGLRARLGPSSDDDDLLTAAMFGIEVLAGLQAARAAQEGHEPVAADTPLDQLVGELERRPWVRGIAIRKEGFAFETGDDLHPPPPT